MSFIFIQSALADQNATSDDSKLSVLKNPIDSLMQKIFPSANIPGWFSYIVVILLLLMILWVIFIKFGDMFVTILKWGVIIFGGAVLIMIILLAFHIL
jgi:hypothetical protein